MTPFKSNTFNKFPFNMDCLKNSSSVPYFVGSNNNNSYSNNKDIKTTPLNFIDIDFRF